MYDLFSKVTSSKVPTIICAYVYIYIHTHTYIHTYMAGTHFSKGPTLIYICIHTYIQYIHTYIHTYVRIHTCISVFASQKCSIQCQKRPITGSKETYYSVKRDLLQCLVHSQKCSIQRLYTVVKTYSSKDFITVCVLRRRDTSVSTQ